jgi:hypothetical protein
MTSIKKTKSYHVTYDGPAVKWIEDDGNVVLNLPYLVVEEQGATGKQHIHAYFHSQLSRNTLRSRITQECKTMVSFSDPESVKYQKYNKDGVKGVEIYLMKGKTNHMKANDDSKVLPLIKCLNKAYYGSVFEPGTRLDKIRRIYEKATLDMKNYKSTVAKITTERKKTELELCLKDLENCQGQTAQTVKDYLAYTHYMRKEYNFTENGYKNLFRKILKEKFPDIYKNQIRNRMDEII